MQHAEFPSCLRFSFTRNKLEKSRKPSSPACAYLRHDWDDKPWQTLVIRILPSHIRWRGSAINTDRLATLFQRLFSCSSFRREKRASTTRSAPVLLPTRNGPCREGGVLHWEYLF